MPISVYLQKLRDKVGDDLVMMPAACGVVLNDWNELLLQKPKHTACWFLPGGAVDPGEQPADAAVREIREETSVRATPVRLAGVYHEAPVRYANGDAVQYLVTVFLCRHDGGTARVNDDELPADLYPPHRERIEHALAPVEAARFQLNGKWKP
jgi:8-oxo-dGTP diphosphatase